MTIDAEGISIMIHQLVRIQESTTLDAFQTGLVERFANGLDLYETNELSSFEEIEVLPVPQNIHFSYIWDIEA